jgi:hypothetical protein
MIIYYSNTSAITNSDQKPIGKDEWPLHYLCQNSCERMQGKGKNKRQMAYKRFPK